MRRVWARAIAVVTIFLCIGCVGCTAKKGTDNNVVARYELPGFGNKVYLCEWDRGQAISVSSREVLKNLDGLITKYEFEEGTTAKRSSLCEREGCNHGNGNPDKVAPGECDALAPYRNGYAFYEGDALYAVGYSTGEQPRIEVSKKSDGEWLRVTAVDGYVPADATLTKHFVEDGKLYLNVYDRSRYQMSFGELANKNYGVIRIDLGTGNYCEVVPPEEALYQTVRYMDKVEDRLIYALVSAPIMQLRETTASTVAEFAAECHAAARVRVRTIDLATLKEISSSEYAIQLSEKHVEGATTDYLAGVSQSGVVYVKDNEVYYRAFTSGQEISLLSLTDYSDVQCEAYGDGMRIRYLKLLPDGETVEERKTYHLTKDGTLSRMDGYEGELRHSFENGYCIFYGERLEAEIGKRITETVLVSDKNTCANPDEATVAIWRD